MSGLPKIPTLAQGVPTRQQLDELDALMQRMLSIPVQAVDDEEHSPQALSQLGSPAPDAHLTAREAIGWGEQAFSDGASSSLSSIVTPPSAWMIPARPDPRFDFAAPESLSTVDREMRQPIVIEGETEPPSSLRSVREVQQSLAGATVGPDSLTQSWDHETRPSGMRTCLGFLGIAFLVLAAAWSVLDFLGWTW